MNEEEILDTQEQEQQEEALHEEPQPHVARSGWASGPEPKCKPSFNNKQHDYSSECANFALGETQECDEQHAMTLARCFAHFGIESVVAKHSKATNKVFSTCGL